MPHTKSHILVIEKNDITRKLIVGILGSRGYESYEALDGDAALAFLAKSPVLVIVDVDGESPDVVGFLHKMQRSHPSLPLVAMSEQEDKAALQTRLGLQHISVLEKPVVPEHLLGNIETHLMRGVEKEIQESARKPAPPDAQDPVLQKRREELMRCAIDLSQEKMDAGTGAPFAAVIARGGRIVAEGWDAVVSGQDPTLHAEIMAIRGAAKALGTHDLAGCELYTTCEPCPMCLAAVYWARIDRVFYANTREDAVGLGFDFEFIYREVALPEHRRTLPARMLLREEAKIVFANWLKGGGGEGY